MVLIRLINHNEDRQSIIVIVVISKKNINLFIKFSGRLQRKRVMRL
ncbi:hypothetical protein XSR1_10011 [Xenorhabdus szentirmaii DSM 16338]|uniref:Uncharacterized protein n=1 Tax=Xenorhabdus szentirmaii DSM 16338 TaxID=1427518 RepID=W1IQ25_9GAMM|nr:hypothetical protein XSR1_10011 [Xenorhabdus szentirmaii DSM 16338]